MEIHEATCVLAETGEIESLLRIAHRIARAGAVETCAVANVKRWVSELHGGLAIALRAVENIRDDVAYHGCCNEEVTVQDLAAFKELEAKREARNA